MHHRQGEHPYGDIGQLIILLIVVATLLVDHFFFKNTLLSLNKVRWFLAFLFLLLSLILMNAGHKAIFKSNHLNRLITDGVFKVVRHPLYLSILIFYFSLILFFNSIFGLVLLLPVFLFYNFIASYEERYLIKKHGDFYLEYQKRTGRWLPKLW